jgi:hypothetical protein
MKNVYEIFEEFEAANTPHERIVALQKNDCFTLRQVLRGSFDPNIEFAIDRVPNYKPSNAPPGMSYTSLAQELGRVYIFQREHPKLDPNLTADRRENILIQILENLEAKEAVVFMNMLLKKQRVRGLDEKVVREAFPNLLS